MFIKLRALHFYTKMTLKNRIDSHERIPKLKEILERKGFVKAIEVHNGLSGLIANDFAAEGTFEKLEFDALWESSLTDSASKGMPDIELVSMDSRLATTEQIARVTNKPIIFDGDTGGEISQFQYLIPRLESIGVSAVIIEDKVFPKRNSLDNSAKQQLEDPKIFAAKIKAGKEMKRSRDFMIIARIESLIAGKGVDDALKRAEIYLKAGADGIMIHSNEENPEKIKEFAKRYKELSLTLGFGKPLVAVPTSYNQVHDSELREFGFNIVIHANHLLRASFNSIEEVCKTILINDRSYEANKLCVPVKKIFEKVGFSTIIEREKLIGIGCPVIITAAGEDRLPIKLGQGEIPKALINVAGKTMLERQVDLFKQAGLQDINVVVGYNSDMFDMPGVKFILNENWQNTFSMHSLMLAKDKMKNGFIYINPDIIFEQELLEKLARAEGDIVVVADDSFPYHKHEIDKDLDLIISKETGISSGFREIKKKNKEISKIGKKINIDEATHLALSFVKFSDEGARNFIKVYEDCLRNYNGPFQEVESIYKADFSDVLQEMITRGFKINYVETHKGWLELHTEKDFELISKYFKES